MASERLTPNQRYALIILKRWLGEGFVPSGHLRYRGMYTPGPMLRRLESRGLVESNGVVLSEGRCYRITGAGIAALSTGAPDEH